MPKTYHALRCSTTLIALALLALVPAAAGAAVGGAVATVHAAGDGVAWQPQIDGYQSLSLIVAGPGGRTVQEFGAGETPQFSLYDAAGGLVADGLYKWELRVTPRLDAATQRSLEAERDTGGARRIMGQLRSSGAVPAAYQSGSFRVVDGALALPGDLEESPGIRSQSAPVRSITAPATVLTTNDGVIIQSLCVGIDCPNSPSFGDTTILMMENNTRIKFGDTSNSASFPANDWEIEANSNANGGANYLAFVDCGTNSNQGGCAGNMIFTTEAGARNNALYLESDGDLGLGTNNPVVDIHVVTGNTPTLRLEQDGSNGFTPQTWDLAGNEANFFIRDVTNGSALPFRIEPGTASNMVYLDSAERVGIGTNSPTNTLHVQRSDGSASVRIEDTSATVELSQMLVLRSEDGQGISFENDGDGRIWSFINNQNGNFAINSSAAPGNEFLINGNNGNVTISGTLVTGGGGSCDPGPCDGTFSPEYAVTPIEEHAAYMWANRHLWGVGPTPEGAPLNLTKKVTGILHELEVAHIYIEQLNGQIKDKDAELSELRESNVELTEQRLPELERANAELAARLATLEALVRQLAP